MLSVLRRGKRRQVLEGLPPIGGRNLDEGCKNRACAAARTSPSHECLVAIAGRGLSEGSYRSSILILCGRSRFDDPKRSVLIVSVSKRPDGRCEYEERPGKAPPNQGRVNDEGTKTVNRPSSRSSTMKPGTRASSISASAGCQELSCPCPASCRVILRITSYPGIFCRIDLSILLRMELDIGWFILPLLNRYPTSLFPKRSCR